jgi:ABC-type Na+ transport system ATPase subunit NatA
VCGLDPQADPDRVARLVGTQLQDSALPDRMRVGEALHLFAALARAPVNEALDRLPGVLGVDRADGRIDVRGRGPFLVSLAFSAGAAALAVPALRRRS